MSDTDTVIIDAREREEALDPSRSFVVEAPAGSGKTGLLMQRFLVLLSTVERPEELLALTFTRKAAGEMQRRIIDALYAASSGTIPAGNAFERKTLELAAKALARDRQMSWRLLDNPGRLKVRTIDSFCASLARQMPLLSKATALDAVDDAAPYYEEAARRTIEMVEDDGVCGDAVRTALRHLDNSTGALTRRLVSMLEKRDQWLRHVKSGDTPDELKERLEGSFGRLVEAALSSAREAFPKKSVPRLAAAARFAAGNLVATMPDSPVAALTGLAGLPGARAEDINAWHGIAGMLVTKDGTWRKPRSINSKLGFPANLGPDSDAARRDFQELLEELTGDDALLGALREVKAAPCPRFEAYDWEALLAFLKLLPVAEAHLTDVFGDRGAVDFQSIAASAMKALGTDDDPTDLLLSLDLSIRHILVDEYQDTSRAQLQLLRALTRGWTEGDGRTLFVVGDPMQSIYMFREAEVGLFLDARINGIGPVALNPLKLRSNFRSSVEIIEWVNGAFAGAFPEREDIFTGSVVYTPSAAANDVKGTDVEITLFEERDDAAEAGCVLRKILDINEGRPDESIAVLCRSRAHLASIVPALAGAGLRFRARELDPLSDRAVVQDLLSLLRAVLHPFDRVAWLAALRAPWCGASMADLHALCTGDRAAPVEELAADIARLSALSEDGRDRIPRAVREIKKAAGNFGRVEIRPLIEGLWTALGGPACVDGTGLDDASAFLDVLGALPPDFTLKEVEDRVEKLYARHGGGPASIDLMTIHKAKGLEFDNVIIPGLGKPPRNEDKKLMLWMERKAQSADDLLLAPIEKKSGGESPLYSYLSRLNKKRSALELVRLFYVAATRARKGLYLFGHAGECVREGTLLSVIKASLDRSLCVSADAPAEAEKTAGVRIRRLPGSWSIPTPAPSIESFAEREAPAVPEPEFRWAGERIRHLGTVVHGYLCRMATDGLDKWDAQRVEKEKGWAQAMLKALGLDTAEAREFSQRAVEVLKNVLNDKRGRWILEAEGGVEEAVTGVVDGEVTHAVIDRTFVDENGVRWVIDYKTGLHEGGNRAEFLESEKERYRPQLERYAAILKEAEKERVIKKGLYFPALLEFIEVP